MAMLDVKEVRRSFGGVHAVAGIDLAIDKGQLVSVIGPNGAGKTTLFNLITGLDVPDAGQILLDGHPIQGKAPEELAYLGMARTFQHGRVFGNLTVRDNVLIGAHTRLKAVRPPVPVIGPVLELALALLRTSAVRQEEAKLNQEVEEIVALFGERLTPRLDQPAYSLSYANRRRVEIARALALKPKILLLDEPTAGMNPTETTEMLGIIRDLKASGLTILLIEHKLDLVMQLSDRVMVMDDGKKIAEGLPQAVRHDPAVIEAYLGHSASSGAAAPAPSLAGAA